MTNRRILHVAVVIAALTGLAGCGGFGSLGSTPGAEKPYETRTGNPYAAPGESTLLDLFTNADDPNTTVEVNKYIWKASLEVLNFLPIESVDPFTGVIITGFGTPPGGGRPYKATILVQDPALDARSLKLALATRSGPASPETVRAVEDAILTRARQLRLADARL